ncbi:MAG: hypothetical protein PVJ57_03880 [Phycisphaerae bacterium]
MHVLLAVDVGLRTGLAWYGQDGRLRAYRSRNFGNSVRLRRAARQLLDEFPGLVRLVVEGGGPLAEIWAHEAQRRQIGVWRVSAEQWRQVLLYPREQRGGRQAKETAGRLARQVIAWSGAPRATALRHDAAEAILIGLWGALAAGWLPRVPAELRH